MKVVVVSGGFDPIHSGHISYLEDAKRLGDILVVALNSDDWLIKKKGKFFMPFHERKTILESMRVVNHVIDFIDDNKGSCINGLKKVISMYPDDEIIFANGGDRNKENIPEMTLKNITFEFGVGGDDKKNSSSWILKNFQYDFEDRVWGSFYNLFSDSGNIKVKVKELIINPKKGLSFQRHFHRSEIWFLSKGACYVNYSEKDAENFKEIKMNEEDVLFIKQKAWHQIINPYNEPCHIIEIQYGNKTEEEDIERLRYYED